LTKRHKLKLTESLKSIKERHVVKAAAIIFIFLVLNALKITLFNYYIIPSPTAEIFKYKFIITILLVFSIYPLILRIKSRLLFIMLYIIQAVYIMANISYYMYFHSYLHIAQWFTLFHEGLMASKNLSAPMNFKLLAAFIELPVFIYIAKNFYRLYDARTKLFYYRLIVAAVSVLLIFSIESANYKKGNSIIQFIESRYKGETPVVERYGTVVNGVASLVLKSSEEKMIDSFEYGRNQKNEEESEDNPNFIIIVVESMDSSVINKKFEDEYITPYLNSLAENNVYYPYVLSYHEGGGTSDSEFSIINSIEPLKGFPALKLFNYNYPNSMLYQLAKSSYEIVAFHGNTAGFFNRDNAFPKMGFDEFYDIDKMDLNHVGWGAPDHEAFSFAADKLRDIKEPYFSYIITMTSHGPFKNARNYYNNSRYDNIENENVKNYFNSMSYVDQSIKDFITDIKRNNKDTYIMIIGDHTPNINTSNYRQSSITMDGSYFEFVPSIIITPDNKQYREEKNAASFLDIAPTVLYNAKILFEIYSDGQNLLDTDENENKIPFNGNEYDRSYLFNRINEH
jgi:lipoteichoic acid synthase